MTNRAQEIIKSYYEEEAARKESEITFADFSVRLNTSDIAMLEVIAKRFGKAAERIASEAVSAAIYSMVEALETNERKQMAKEADELNESLAKKAARANGKADFDEKSVTWVMNDRAITREENRRKKEQDESTPAKADNNPTDSASMSSQAAEEEFVAQQTAVDTIDASEASASSENTTTTAPGYAASERSVFAS